MPRSLTAGTLAALGERGGFKHLVQIEASDGTLRLATAAQTIAWDSETWSPAGGVLEIGEVTELAESEPPGVELSLSDVDSTIIAELMNAHIRGRAITIWRVRLGADGSVTGDPVKDMLFTGFANEDWVVEETHPERGGGTVTVKTRAVARSAMLQQTRSLTMAVDAHNAMLERLNASPSLVGDTFCSTVASIAGREIFWGTSRPTTYGGGGPGPGQWHPGSQS